LDENTILSQRIGKIRKALGLTQVEFANDLKISPTHIGAMEKGTRKIPERIIKIICFTYQVNESWFKTGKGDMFKKGRDFKLEEVVKNFNKLDELLQDYVLKQIRLALEYQEAKEGENSRS